MTGRRGVFPLRFKNPRTREALKHLSEQVGVPMTDIVETAIEHELVLQGADLEHQLEQALAVVRSYRAGRDDDAYVAEIEAGERGDLDPFTQVTGSHDQPLRARLIEVEDRFGIAAAFARH